MRLKLTYFTVYFTTFTTFSTFTTKPNYLSLLNTLLSEKEKTEKDLLAEISQKLDKIIALLAIQGKDENTQIRILKKLGFDAEEIGKLLGITGRLRDKKAWKEN